MSTYKNLIFVEYLSMPSQKKIIQYLKEAIWLIFSFSFNFLSSLILIKLLTNYLNPKEFGELNLILSITAFVTSVFFGGISNGIGRFYSVALERNQLPEYIYSSFILILRATLILFIVTIVLFSFLKSHNDIQNISVYIVAIFYGLLSSYVYILKNIQNQSRNRFFYALHTVFESGLKIILVFFIFKNISGSGIRVLSIYVSVSMMILFLYIFIYCKQIIINWSKFVAKRFWVKNILSFSFPFYLTIIFGWAQQNSSRWALDLYSSKYDVGLFSVLLQLGYTTMEMSSSVAITFLSPYFYERVGDGSSKERNDNIEKLTNKIAIIGYFIIALIVLFSCFCHQGIFELFINKKFSSVSYLLPIMLLSGGIFGIAQLYALKLQSLYSVNKIIYLNISFLVMGILFSFAGVYCFGIKGATISSLLYSVSYFMLMRFWKIK